MSTVAELTAQQMWLNPFYPPHYVDAALCSMKLKTFPLLTAAPSSDICGVFVKSVCKIFHEYVL